MDFELKTQGFIYSLFSYLQVTDPLTKEKPNVNIPETIQIRLGVPIAWIYSQNGEVLRKNKNKLNMEAVKERFECCRDENRIQAVWVYPRENTFYFDYFTKPQLLHFLETSITFDTSGFIQRFIYPKSEHNEVIKSVWSSNLCLFEGYQNRHNIHDSKADILQRVVTFENPNGPVTQFTVKGKVLP